MQKAYPDQFNFQSEVLLVNLLFDNKQPEEGFQAASQWVEKHPNPTEAAELVNIVHFKGNTKMADALIGHFSDDKINASPELLEAFIFVQLSEGRDEAAYQRLYTLYKEKKLPRTLNAQLLILVTQRGDKPLTHALLEDATLSIMSETQLLTLVELAGTQKDPVLLAKITKDFEGEESSKLYPGLSAALAVANHQSNAGAMLARLDTVDFSHEESLQELPPYARIMVVAIA